MTRFCVQATWADVLHLSDAQKASLWSTIPAHQRDARIKGIPVLGSGRVFVAPEEKIACEPVELPRRFARITGVDLGIGERTVAGLPLFRRNDRRVFNCDAQVAP
jgi:hypothetical protein